MVSFLQSNNIDKSEKSNDIQVKLETYTMRLDLQVQKSYFIHSATLFEVFFFILLILLSPLAMETRN